LNAIVTLRTRLLLLVLLAILPSVLIEVYGEVQLRATRQQEISQEAMRLLRVVAAEQQRIDEGVRQLLVAFSESDAVRAQDWPRCGETAKLILARVDGYVNMGVATSDGDLLCSALPPPVGKDMQRRSILEEMSASRDLLIGRYHIGLITNESVLTFAISLPDGGGSAALLAWANIDLNWLARHFADRFTSKNLTLLLADRAGTILLRLPDNESWVGKPMGDRFTPMLHAATEGTIDTIGIDGQRRLIAYSPLATEPKGLFLGVGLSPAPYLGPIDTATFWKVVLIALSLALALGAAWLIGDALISRPIGRLLVAAHRWEQGDLSARTELTGNASEIVKLGQAFDKMASAVESRDHMRVSAEKRLAQLNSELEERVRGEVAAREEIQRELAQAQKMDAVGKLTGGVAHDFNNLLAVMVGNLDLLHRRAADPGIRQLAENALRAAKRGAKLTDQLLAFSREHPLDRRVFNINDLIFNMSDMLVRTLGPSIQIRLDLAPELWPVFTDENQIELAILNLALNSRDSMPNGGKLTVVTSNLSPGDSRLPEKLSGDFVMLAVSDTGAGMTEPVRTRAFEPFFTTKEIGKGTGLGLSTVYGLATQSGGIAIIESAVGDGTTVSLFLPRSEHVQADGEVETSSGQSFPAKPLEGKVLVIDDDVEVREVTVASLRQSGLSVTAVENGGAALALIESRERFALMIVDYAMPGINGAEVIARARKICPHLRAILLTGYAERGFSLPPDVPVLRKPFRTGELTECVWSTMAKAELG